MTAAVGQYDLPCFTAAVLFLLLLLLLLPLLLLLLLPLLLLLLLLPCCQVYGCRIVVTNVSSVTRTLDVFKQVPLGAIPVERGSTMATEKVALSAYTTRTFSYYYYFPRTGNFQLYPVQVSSDVCVPPSSSALRDPASHACGCAHRVT